MNIEKLRELKLYDFIREHATKHGRWYNFIEKNSVALPFELMSDNKVIHYKWHKNREEKFQKLVLDIIYTAVPGQSIEKKEKEFSEIYHFIKSNIFIHGYHMRSTVFKRDGEVAGYCIRIFDNSDWPCHVHPEFITHSTGRSPCPACYTAVTFGEFHPIEIVPVNSRFEEKTQ